MSWGLQRLHRRIICKYGSRQNEICTKHRKFSARLNSSEKPAVILGIETSCDDTACGIVDSNKNILSNERFSQHEVHLRFGGIIPPIAQKLHAENITTVCEKALRAASLRLRDIDAISVTVKPGLIRSLHVGTDFAKYLSRIGNKPLIPIHHMQAHALTARLIEQIEFPYLSLLISGGHCMITIVQNVDTFYILGNTISNAPGELFDKVARKLKLSTIPEFSKLHGGHAIEMAARKASKIEHTMFNPSMTQYADCNFSFSGLTAACLKRIQNYEIQNNTRVDTIIPQIYELCAAYQYSAVLHICHRVQRAIEYVNRKSLFPENNRTFVVSGGVASNEYLANALNTVCTKLDFKFVRTPPEFCTDNGVMIAWNGMEKWLQNTGVITNLDEIEKVQAESSWPIGEDWAERVAKENIKCKWVKILV